MPTLLPQGRMEKTKQVIQISISTDEQNPSAKRRFKKKNARS